MSTRMHRAIVVQEGKTTAVQEVPIPDNLKPNEILMKTVTIGVNPGDYKHVVFGLSSPGAILGCDFIGVVVNIGSAVPKEVQGQLRGGFLRGGMNNENGAFAEHVRSAYDVTFVVPKNLTPQQAASMPVPLLTACQALYYRLGIPRPDADSSKYHGKWILIWSGSTSVGQYAIQLAKLAGLRVATTASPGKYDMLKALGAEVIIDYKDPEVAQKLRAATEYGISLGVDCISSGGSIQLCQSSFGSQGGHLVCLLFDLGEPVRKDVKTEATVAVTMLGEDTPFGPTIFKTTKEDRENMVVCCELLPKLFEQGKLRPLEITDMGGLETVQESLDMLQAGTNKTKLVHTLGAL